MSTLARTLRKAKRLEKKLRKLRSSVEDNNIIIQRTHDQTRANADSLAGIASLGERILSAVNAGNEERTWIEPAVSNIFNGTGRPAIELNSNEALGSFSDSAIVMPAGTEMKTGQFVKVGSDDHEIMRDVRKVLESHLLDARPDDVMKEIFSVGVFFRRENGTAEISDSGKVLNFNGQNFLEYNEWNKTRQKEMANEASVAEVAVDVLTAGIAKTNVAEIVAQGHAKGVSDTLAAVWDAMGMKHLSRPAMEGVLAALERRASEHSDIEWRQRLSPFFGVTPGQIVLSLEEIVERLTNDRDYNWKNAVSGALGVQWGEANLTLDEAVERIKEMKNNGNFAAGQQAVRNTLRHFTKGWPAEGNRSAHAVRIVSEIMAYLETAANASQETNEQNTEPRHAEPLPEEECLDRKGVSPRVIKDNPQA